MKIQFGEIEKSGEKKDCRTGSTGGRKFKEDKIAMEWKNNVFICLFVLIFLK